MTDHDKSQDMNTNKKRGRDSSPKQSANDNGSRHRRGRGEKSSNDVGETVAPGSYAHESLRTLLGIELPFSITDPADATSMEAADDSKLPSKKKVAMLVGYLGTRYGGFQMNCDQRTVQAEIELALYKAKLLSKSNFGYPFKYNWSTSGRTDKGVHACAQVCGAKLHIGDAESESALDDVRERINQELPEDVRILHLVRTTRGFCAKTMRSHVRYQYMIPSYCLHPNLKQLFIDHGITWNNNQNFDGTDTKPRSASDPLTAEERKTMQAVLSNYRATPDQLERLQQALSALQGTHSFHQFTKSVSASDAKAKRYIVSYTCQEPLMLGGMEWIPTQVMGQSFLVYQVRKMTSLVLDVARGAAPLSIIASTLAKNSDIRLNTAPAQGLFKEMSYYGSYNQRKKQSNAELQDLEWDKAGSSVHERWLDFKGRVLERIVKEEETHANFITYMFNHEFIFRLSRHYNLDQQPLPDGQVSPDTDLKG
jgi:tRNA pseudouridine38-40 synthase